MITNKKAAGANQTAYKSFEQHHYNQNQDTFTQKFNRDLLPAPAKYYKQQFPKMRIKSEWVKVCCPFHDDHNPSLNINMVSGGFKCWACSAHGGDVLAFQMLRYKQTFKQAAMALDAWRTE
ncbi:MAG: hypothetical protein KAT71_05240 [Gammaproteobacteria bacterium]|nr:hypothetical protein [Gammaproteobacteria bacterium]